MLTAAYDVLGLPLGATPDQVDRAWRQFARLNHPDHGGDAAEFIRGRAAYDQLLDVFRYGYRIPVETYWELEPAYQHVTTFQRDDSLLIPSGIRRAPGPGFPARRFATASAPSLLKPIRLMIASCSG